MLQFMTLVVALDMIAKITIFYVDLLESFQHCLTSEDYYMSSSLVWRFADKKAMFAGF